MMESRSVAAGGRNHGIGFGEMKAFVVEHISHGNSDLEAVFTVRADAQNYVDWYNAQRRGERRETHEWLVVEVPLNPHQHDSSHLTIEARDEIYKAAMAIATLANSGGDLSSILIAMGPLINATDRATKERTEKH